MSTAPDGRAFGARLLWAIGLAVAAALARSPWTLVALGAVALAGIGLAGRSEVLPRLVLPALALGAIALAINLVAAALTPLGPLGGVGTWSEGLRVGAWTAGRLVVTAFAFGGLAATTDAGRALDGLASGPLRLLGRRGGELAVLAMVALRFGPLVAAEGRRLVRTVALRAERRPGPWAAPAIAVPLVLTAVRRADRLAYVLEARHFGAATRTPPVPRPWDGRDRALAFAGVALPVVAARIGGG